jgi:hypothetical protein
VGLFVGDQELLLTPDENIDRSSHHSGDTLELTVLNGQPGKVKNIPLKNYGPMGELAVSQNGKMAVALSWYVPAHILAHEETPLPASSSPQAVILGMGVSPQVVEMLPIEAAWLPVGGWMESRRPKVSADGSLIAIAQRGGIAVFKCSLPF